MVHLSAEQLSASLDELLSGPSLDIVERHLDACEQCRRERADMAAQDEVIARLLIHEPTDSFFDKFAEDLDELLRTDGQVRRRKKTGTATRVSAARPASQPGAS